MWYRRPLIIAAGIIAVGLIASSLIDLMGNRYAVSASANQNIAYRVDTLTGGVSVCVVQEPRLMSRQVQAGETVDVSCSTSPQERLLLIRNHLARWLAPR